MATEIEKLVVALEARIAQYQRDLTQAQAVTQTKISAVEAKFVEAEKVISASMARAAASTATSMASMTAAMSAAGRASLAQSIANQRMVSGMGAVGVAAANAVRPVTDIAAGMASIGRVALAQSQINERLISGMSAFGGAAGIATNKIRALPPALRTTTEAMRTTTQSGVGLGTMMGALATYMALGTLRAYADSWNSITRAIDASEQIFGIRLRSAEALNRLANEARIDNDSLAKLYIRTAAATRELGVAEEDVAKVAQTVAMALKMGSASASEQTSTMLQLSQALQKGKLDGDEFRTVMENAGVIQELLADRLKVSKGEIVKMAAEGKLKVNDLFGALLDGGEKVRRLFEQMPATLEEGFIVLNNQIEQYIGHLDRTYGFTQTLSNGLAYLARNIETVGDAALVAGIGLLAMFAPAIIAGIVGLGAAAVATAGGLGVLTGVLGAGVAAFSLFGDRVAASEDGLVSYNHVLRAFTKELAVTLNQFDEFERKFAFAGPAFRAQHMEDMVTRVRRTARELAMIDQWTENEHGGTTVQKAIEAKPNYAGSDTADKAAERARKAFEKDLLRAEQRITMAKLEGEAIGRSAEEVEYMRTRQELLNEARKAGIELTDADMIRIEALALGTARAVTAYENLKRAQEEVAQESKEMLSQFIKDMKNGVSASEALGSALDRIADKLIDMAVNDLVELALGGLSGKGGNPSQAGLASGLLSLFGFKDGGIAANGRPQPLPRFANGGVARSASIFGEAGPEAAVPLKGGRYIPVEITQPKIPTVATGQAQAVNLVVAPVFNVENGSPEGIDKMQAEVLPKIRDMVDQRVGQLFDRKARFARSGI